MKKGLLVFILVMMWSVYGYAQIVTDRPDQTESSATVGRNNLQIETGILVGFTGDQTPSVRQVLAPTTLFRYGISKKIEIRVLSQFESIKQGNINFSGISDLELGTKIQLYQKESSKTEMAFLTHIVMPTGSEELTNEDFGSISKLSISHELSDDLAIGYNIGYDYFGTGNGDMTYSIALGKSLNDLFGLYIEAYGSLIDLEEFEHSFDAGVTYLPNDFLQLDFSFGTGLNYTMNYISVGLSYLIEGNSDD